MFCLLLVGSIISIALYCHHLHCTVKKDDSLFLNLTFMDFIVVCMFAVSFLSYEDTVYSIIATIFAYVMLTWQLFSAEKHLSKDDNSVK